MKIKNFKLYIPTAVSVIVMGCYLCNSDEFRENFHLPMIETDVNDLVVKEYTKLPVTDFNFNLTFGNENSELETETEIVEYVPDYSRDLLDSGYEFLNIDFDALKEINPEACAWITLDGSNINYPVMYPSAEEHDNSYYLKKDIYGKPSIYGTIYVDKYNSSLASGYKNLSNITVLYGHCMKNGTMFANIRNFKKQQNYYDEHKFAVIYTPDGFAYKASFIGGVARFSDDYNYLYDKYVSKDDGSYDYFDVLGTEEEFMEFKKYLKENSTFESDVEFEYGDKILALVTCNYDSSGDRYVLYAVLQKELIYEEKQELEGERVL